MPIILETKQIPPDLLQFFEVIPSMPPMSDVMRLSPEPYSEAHFATFPTEIPRRAILAGTSARGCCPKCFAPWERIVEKQGETAREKLKQRGSSEYANGQPESAQGLDYAGGHGNNTRETRTTGWQPSCKCYGKIPDIAKECHGKETGWWYHQNVAPCTVLDIFGGSGTTGAVAVELGRNAILCELNDAYLPLIDKRTAVTPGLALA